MCNDYFVRESTEVMFTDKKYMEIRIINEVIYMKCKSTRSVKLQPQERALNIHLECGHNIWDSKQAHCEAKQQNNKIESIPKFKACPRLLCSQTKLDGSKN